METIKQIDMQTISTISPPVNITFFGARALLTAAITYS